ncbi:MAG: hypothetical protein FWH21_00375 [Kiritimatiellaeota bacterium]|nr:hypothetical protein [Kiritimatiellota bacterium]
MTPQQKPPLGCVLPLAIIFGLLGALGIAYFFGRITPDHQYGGWGGWWHGANFIGNLLLRIFNPDRLLKAPLYSGSYAFFFETFRFLAFANLVLSPIKLIKRFSH